jgi:choline kinase
MPSVEFSRPLAILLAAGIGRRLGGIHEGPKVLLEFGGCSLIERHIDALTRNGVSEIAVTVGYRAETLSKILAGRADMVDNPAYREGSILSLWAQRVRLCGRISRQPNMRGGPFGRTWRLSGTEVLPRPTPKRRC